MQCTYREICSQEDTLEKDHIKEERNRLCGKWEVRTLEKEHRVIEENRGQKETLIQQMSIEEYKDNWNRVTLGDFSVYK